MLYPKNFKKYGDRDKFLSALNVTSCLFMRSKSNDFLALKEGVLGNFPDFDLFIVFGVVAY